MADKKKPKVDKYGNVMPNDGKPLYSGKRTPEQAAQDLAAYRAEVEREYARTHQEKLPEPGLTGWMQQYALDHPVQADYFNRALGAVGGLFSSSQAAAPTPTQPLPFGKPALEQPLGGGVSSHPKNVSGIRVPNTTPGMLEAGNIDMATRPQVKTPDGKTATVYSRSYNIDGQEVLLPTVTDDGRILTDDKEIVEQYRKTGKHLGKFDTPDNADKFATKLHEDEEARIAPRGTSVRDAMRGALAPAMGTLHKKYGVSKDDVDTVIGGFIDSPEGRSLGDNLLANPGIASDVVKGYEQYVKQWSGRSAAVDMPDPVVIDAAKASPQELAAAIKGPNPVLVKNASDLGLDQDRVMVYGPSGKSRTKPEAVVKAGKAPVISNEEFVDVLKYIRGG